ncbi:MAG: radical SAM protein [Candidatus Omnitrophica bacterium]|nr:radical SAM protein [Candidatus Omnitrophota bacterium]
MSGPTLSSEEIQKWLQTDDPARERELFLQARELTVRRFAHRIVLFAPLYVSNVCVNNCLYCGFRRDNALLERRVLGREEVRAEAEAVAGMGHQTVLIVAGEHPEYAGPRAIAEDIASVQKIPAIRDIKVEAMPMSVEGYRQLYEAGARGVILYQETYDRATYAQAHPSGPKANYEWRLTALERAIEAGFRRVGLGILVGLGDVAFDAAMLIAHAREIHTRFGIWPSTVSLPRLQPAQEAPWSFYPPHPVDDRAFLRLVALIRVALPEVGMTLSTRECAVIRDRALEMGLGVTQMSAGSRTSVGGYTSKNQDGQFSIQDERPVSAVADRLKSLGYEPVWSEEEGP